MLSVGSYSKTHLCQTLDFKRIVGYLEGTLKGGKNMLQSQEDLSWNPPTPALLLLSFRTVSVLFNFSKLVLRVDSGRKNVTERAEASIK